MQLHEIALSTHSRAFPGLPDLVEVQDFVRNSKRRGKKVGVIDDEEHHDYQFQTRADLLNFMRDHGLPATYSELEEDQVYAVDGVAAICDDPVFENTLGIALVSKRGVDWIKQLLDADLPWALHGDGKHKLHHGRWILLTFGTHALRWDKKHKCYRHSFRPLIYLFCREIETIASVRLCMVALQLVALHFFQRRLEAGATISDQGARLMGGMRYINIAHGVATAEGEEEVTYTPHFSDWAHIATHYKQGRLLPRANLHFGEVWHYLKAVHFAHSTEQGEYMTDLICRLMEDWEQNGAPQPGKYTTATLRKEYLTPPRFSIATYDGMVNLNGHRDLPLIAPCNQCQESWHNQLMRRLKKGGHLRGSTRHCLTVTFPRIVRQDEIKMPLELCFQPEHFQPAMIAKALKFIDYEGSHIREGTRERDGYYFVLRFAGHYSKLTVRLVKAYWETLEGKPPRGIKEFDHAETDKDELMAVINVCASVHMVMTTPDPTEPCNCVKSSLNPAFLTCTCKGYRRVGICSHVIAITALFIPEKYDHRYLESLLERLTKTKRKAHRPKNVVAGNRTQPHGDSEEEAAEGGEEGAGEEEEEEEDSRSEDDEDGDDGD